MDDQAEVREFLASRRAKISPEQAGVPLYGTRRRVPGLRREEGAQLTGHRCRRNGRCPCAQDAHDFGDTPLHSPSRRGSLHRS